MTDIEDLFGYTEKQLVESAHEYHYMSFSTDLLIERSLTLAYKISKSMDYQSRDRNLFEHVTIMYILHRRHA